MPRFALLMLFLATSPLLADDWIGFRGGEKSGVSESAGLPATWSDEENVLWRQELPGLGSSSPALMGNRIYLTCYSGYAESIDDPGDKTNLVRHVVCVNRATGSPVWKRDFPAKQPESDYQGNLDTKHGYASSTITSDGKRLYVFFGTSGVLCLNLRGDLLWQADVGTGTHGWGSGTSPLLVENLVIVNASIESQSLIALHKRTGKEVWRVEGIRSCWASPTLIKTESGLEVVLNVPRRVTAYAPNTGEELWYCDGIPDSYVCPSVIAHRGVIYAIGGRQNTSIAIRAGGHGDVTDSHVLWRKNKGSNVGSPVLVEGDLYWLHDNRGIAYCLDGATGDVQFEERLRPRPGEIYGSATYADGKIYVPSRFDGTYVLAALPDELQLLAVNQFASDPSRCNSSLAIAEDRIYLRTDKALYCLGER